MKNFESQVLRILGRPLGYTVLTVLYAPFVLAMYYVVGIAMTVALVVVFGPFAGALVFRHWP